MSYTESKSRLSKEALEAITMAVEMVYNPTAAKKKKEEKGIILRSVSEDGIEKVKTAIKMNSIPLSAKKRLAKQGNGEAQLVLGVAYANGGEGLKKNLEKSFYWYQKAANNDVLEAKFQLGLSYLRGEGTSEDSAKGFYWIKKAAEEGHLDAQNQVGIFYATGTDFLEKNEVEAEKWYRKAAEKGLAAAQFNLGNVYFHGLGVEENTLLGVEWWGKSAEQGHKDGIYNLGVYYSINEEYDKAFPLLRKSAELGNDAAQFMVAYACEKGLGVTKNDNAALSWARKSAEQGNDCGQCMLGQKFFQKKDTLLEGVFWLLKSMEQGNKQAEKFLIANREKIYLAGVHMDYEGDVESARICFDMAKNLGYVADENGNGTLVLLAVVAVFVICVILKFAW